MSLVQEIADEQLREAAKTLHAKIASHALNRRKMPEAWGFGLYEFQRVREGLKYMQVLRQAIRERCKLRIGYQSLVGERSARTIRPLQTDYWGRVWTLSAWCERRSEFRVFRIDRIDRCEETGIHFEDEPGKTIEDYLKHVDQKMSADQGDRAVTRRTTQPPKTSE